MPFSGSLLKALAIASLEPFASATGNPFDNNQVLKIVTSAIKSPLSAIDSPAWFTTCALGTSEMFSLSMSFTPIGSGATVRSISLTTALAL